LACAPATQQAHVVVIQEVVKLVVVGRFRQQRVRRLGSLGSLGRRCGITRGHGGHAGIRLSTFLGLLELIKKNSRRSFRHTAGHGYCLAAAAAVAVAAILVIRATLGGRRFLGSFQAAREDIVGAVRSVLVGQRRGEHWRVSGHPSRLPGVCTGPVSERAIHAA